MIPQHLNSSSLKSRVTLFTLAIFLACMWSLAFYGRTVVRETMLAELSQQQYLTASYLAGGVNQELENHLVALESIAASISPAILHDERALRAALHGRPVFRRMFDGRTFAFAADALSPAPGQAVRADSGMPRACMASAVARDKATVCQPYVRAPGTPPLVGMAVPIRDVDGKVIGALGGISDLGKSGFLNKLAHQQFGLSGAYQLVVPQHRLVALSSDGRRTMMALDAPGANPALDQLIQASEASGRRTYLDGIDTLASVSTVPLAGWRILITTPTAVAFAPLEAARTRILMATILLSLLTAGLTWLMLKRLLAPMLDAARILAAHADPAQPLQRLPIKHNDEIGKLIGSFNRLLDTVHQRQEALAASEERFRCLTEMSADFYWESDREHQLTRRTDNKRAADTLAFQGASVIEADWQALRPMLDAHRPFRRLELTRRGRDGELYHFAISGDPVFDAGGAFAGYRGVGSDISARKQAQLALLASEQRLGVVLDGVQNAVITINTQGVIESVNQYGLELFGYQQDDLVGNNISVLMPEPYRSRHARYIDQYRRTGIRKVVGSRRELVGQRHDGSTFPIELGVYEASVGEAKMFVGTISDISFRKQAEAELRIAATAFESQQAMFVTDADTVILRINQAFTEITGYDADDVVGQTPKILQSGEHGVNFYREMWDSLIRTGRWSGEILGRRKNGDIYPKWLTITAVTDAHGLVTHYVGAHFDISERKKKDDQVRKLAFYDPLTELPNRRLLNDRLGQAMAVGRRNGTLGALMFLDLDNFKALNDTHGHAVGDLLLVEAAIRLKRCVRQVDTVARFGGDEFVVVLSDLHADRAQAVLQATLVAEKIRNSLAERYLLTVTREGVIEATVEHTCTVSIGVAMFIEHTSSQDDILKWADTAMYRAKQRGKNKISFFEPR